MQHERETLQAWADIVTKRFKKKMDLLKIGDTGALEELIYGDVINESNGDPAKIEFYFFHYGRFPDMGVGKGVKIGQAGINNNRKVKPWLAKTFFGQVYKLGQILAEKTGERAAITIFEGITE
jgi:hypothetical protein